MRRMVLKQMTSLGSQGAECQDVCCGVEWYWREVVDWGSYGGGGGGVRG